MHGTRPTTRRPAFVLLAAGIAAGVALAAVTVARADDPTTLRGEAARLAAENARLSERAEAALLDLFALETRLANADRRLGRLDARLAAVEEERRRAAEALDLARAAEASAQAQLAERLRALYVEGEANALEILLGAASLEDAIDVIDSLRRLAEEDDRIVTQVRESRQALRAAARDLGERQERLRALAAEADHARAALAAARDERSRYLASLLEQRRLNAEEIAALEAAARAAEQRAQELQASSPPSEPAPHPASEPASPPAPEPTPEAAEEASPVAADASPEPGRQVTVSMTMYCLTGTTATGIPVGHGVVATDPAVIPLGTRMYIPGYGEGVAADTGGAVIGLTIDAWVADCDRAEAWGRRTVTITIYD